MKKQQKTYVLHKVDTPYYKIGKSIDVKKRERTLQAEDPLSIIKTIIVIDFNIESELHFYFSSKRVRGEWFKLDSDDLSFIEEIKKNGFVPKKYNQGVLDENGLFYQMEYNYFYASHTAEKWALIKNCKSKNISEFLRLKSTKKIIEYFIENNSIAPFIIYKKSYALHSSIFSAFCRWISSDLLNMFIVEKKYDDSLLLNLNDAGDYYNQMCATIMEVYCNRFGTKPPSNIYIKEANMLKKIANLEIDRNEMTEKDLNRLTVLQKVNANLIRRQVGIESRKKHLEIINDSLI